MKKTNLLLCILFGGLAYSQVGINTTNPNPSTALDIVSSSKGVLIPRLTTAQKNAIVTPADGLQIFNTDIGCIQFYSSLNNSWLNLCGSSEKGTVVSKFLAFRDIDLQMPGNNQRYDISFNRIETDALSTIGGSYNSATGGFTLPVGLYEISYSLVAIPSNADYLDNPSSADIFVSSFENVIGNSAGSEIYGVSISNNRGTPIADTRTASLQNTFYMNIQTPQTFYLKGKFYNGGGGLVSANKVFAGGASYNKPHLNNFISIKLLK
ncbi:complement C1q domain-containing protein [Chryseobacterium potabilaquae]|uniref:C1q domain-containing protein n=1 Tax=Chryseobacterium potabilaquae TaxID=2675057 RepID=A0A6N4XFG2_9FLAO|nr:hypothetical protein [Chryseobacterium potabilaquae]CAA7197397.1 hypothetical protein CHRY9293_03456 [Chryseobacterium potabilaquae]